MAEYQKVSVNINCPIHPSEIIQRIATEVNPVQELYCMECILSKEDPTSLSPSLKTIPDLIATASVFYAQNKSALKPGEQVPQEYIEIVAHQNEMLETLRKHIEEEKKKVSNVFDSLMQDVVKIISEKKNEYLHGLDQQLFNLRYWYIFVDKQIKKAYPSEEDIPFLYPSQEDLVHRLGKITNATHLMAFVRNLKEDLNEQKFSSRSTRNLEEDKNAYLKKLSSNLAEVANSKPFYQQKLEFPLLKDQNRRYFTETIYKMFELEDPVLDVMRLGTFNSKFLKNQDFQLLKSWFPVNMKFVPRLIYQGSRDGMQRTQFRHFCHEKKNTISIIKAKFPGQKESSLFGGFLDKPWTVGGQYIKSEHAFIFSLTTRVKCEVTGHDYAAQGKSKGGPIFGGSPDLQVIGEKCYLALANSFSYKGIEKINENKNYYGEQMNLHIEDIEVYTLD